MWSSAVLEPKQRLLRPKEGLLYIPILALPDSDRPFSVVCDASNFAIGCALLQTDVKGRERIIAFESRPIKAAEKTIQFTTMSYLL